MFRDTSNVHQPQTKPEANRQVTDLKKVYASALIIICSLMLTGFLGAEHAVDPNILQNTSAPSYVGTEADDVTPSTPDYAANLDSGSSSQIVNNPNYPQGVINQNRQQSITLPDETSNSQTTVPTEVDNGTAHIGIGVNYLSLYHMYSSKYTTDEILHRDFSHFRRDGISVISLSLYWYRLEGNARGDYDGEYKPYPQESGGTYGKRFLDDVKRVINIAHQHGLKVLVTFQTLWGDDSSWCTPDYVVDPVTGKNIGLAIVRSVDMKQAFIDMFNHTVSYLAGIPGISAWVILNEPWYWGRTPNEHDFVTSNGMTQKENFINLIQQLSDTVKEYDGRPVTVRFCSTSVWTGADGLMRIKNIFVNDWGWDQRIFNALDFMSFNAYISTCTELKETWQNMTATNVIGSYNRGKVIWISEFGLHSSDSEAQAKYVKESMQFFKTLPIASCLIWFWQGDNVKHDTFGFGGVGYNLCADATTGDVRIAYYELMK